MRSWALILLLLCLALRAKTQELNLFDALGDDDPTPPPKVKDKLPEGGATDDLDILDAFDFGKIDPPAPTPAHVDPKKPAAGGDDSGLDLMDALGPDPEPKKPSKPAVNPNSGGGGGTFGDGDLNLDGDGYKPDPGRGGRAQDPAYDPNAGAGAGDAGDAQAGTGQIAGIASAIGMALLGAASSYFAYQKKKLCFKLQGGVDPESGKGQRTAESDPQEQDAY